MDPTYTKKFPHISMYRNIVLNKYVYMVWPEDSLYALRQRDNVLSQLIHDVHLLESLVSAGYDKDFGCHFKKCLKDPKLRSELHKTPTSLMRKLLLKELLNVHSIRFSDENLEKGTTPGHENSDACRARSFLAYCALLDNLCFSRLPRYVFRGQRRGPGNISECHTMSLIKNF